MISGKKSDLENVKSIKVPVSVEGAKADVEQEIDLTQYLYNTGCKLTEEKYDRFDPLCDREKW